MTSPITIQEDFRSMKGGPGEKIAMTSPVGTDMSKDGSKYVRYVVVHGVNVLCTGAPALSAHVAPVMQVCGVLRDAIKIQDQGRSSQAQESQSLLEGGARPQNGGHCMEVHSATFSSAKVKGSE
jgi:hypothetical protein